jgi:hypothetical protein
VLESVSWFICLFFWVSKRIKIVAAKIGVFCDKALVGT